MQLSRTYLVKTTHDVGGGFSVDMKYYVPAESVADAGNKALQHIQQTNPQERITNIHELSHEAIIEVIP